MSFMKTAIKRAFTAEGRSVDAVWNDYLPKEQAIYEYILNGKVTKIEGTLKNLQKGSILLPNMLLRL